MSTISHVVLKAQNLPGLSAFYQQALGLAPMLGDPARLGAAGKLLLELESAPDAAPFDRRQAGLFHTAFLLPDRPALARWLRHAAESGIRLSGASDHGVSEALYLDDPEGNGIEIYHDRDPAMWERIGDRITMYTRRLDLNELAATADGPWQGAPEGSRIGHVHLQVGDIGAAGKFFTGPLGLTQTFDAPGGAWYGWNGYHHHLAGNVWNSRDAGPRDPGMAGLAEIVLEDAPRSGEVVTDPWGTRFRFA